MERLPRLPTTGPDIAAIVRQARSNPAAPIGDTTQNARLQTVNYAHYETPKKSNLAHFPISEERQAALDIIRWCATVAGIPGDSPRFCYYVSRWNVPGKVERARNDGTLDALLTNCPPINPAWLANVPAALAEWRAFTAKTTTPKTPKSCATSRA